MRTAALSLFALAALACGCRKPATQTPPAPEPGAGEGEKLQGVWKVESWDVVRTPPPGEDEQKKAKAARFVFHNDRLVVLVPAESREAPVEKLPARAVALFEPDAGSNPRALKLSKVAVGAGNDGVLGEDRAEWAYQLDGDALVVAVTEFGPAGSAPKRAAEFKAAPAAADRSGVEVVRLKKSNEGVPDWVKDLTVRTLEGRGAPPKK